MADKKNISIIAVVYNEEARIAFLLESFAWSSDVIIIDKSSTDRTAEIAALHGAKVISVPYSDTGDELKFGVSAALNEWIMTVTASDVIHPALVKKLLDKINEPDFDYEVISLPFALYVFGIRDPKRSPWCVTNKPWMMKKQVLKPSKEVHREMSVVSKRVYVMPEHDKENLYHLTHETLEIFLERHTRYTRLEADLLPDEKTALNASWKELWTSVRYIAFTKKSYLLGWDGIALGLAYISYFIFKYLFVWEKFRGRGRAEYARIRTEILGLHDAAGSHNSTTGTIDGK